MALRAVALIVNVPRGAQLALQGYWIHNHNFQGALLDANRPVPHVPCEALEAAGRRSICAVVAAVVAINAA